MGGGLYRLPFPSAPTHLGHGVLRLRSVCFNVRPAHCGGFVCADVPLGQCRDEMNNGSVAAQIKTDQRMPSVAR